MVDSALGEDLVAFGCGPIRNGQLLDRRHQAKLECGLVVCRARRYDEPTADLVQRIAEPLDHSSPVDLRALVHTVDDDDHARTPRKVGSTVVAPTGQFSAPRRYHEVVHGAVGLCGKFGCQQIFAVGEPCESLAVPGTQDDHQRPSVRLRPGLRNQPGLPRSLATEDAQGCTGRVTGHKRPDLGNQSRSRMCGAVGFIERRQWFAEHQCCLLPAGERRCKPSGVLSPCDLCSNQRFTEVATKLLRTGIEVTGRPDRVDGGQGASVGGEEVSRGVCRHGERDSQRWTCARPVQNERRDSEVSAEFL